MDGATATVEDAGLCGAGRAIPLSGRGRSSAVLHLEVPSWVRQLGGALENER